MEDTSILRLDGSAWSEFESGENLWDTSSNGVVLEGASIEGTDYLFVAADDTIRKFRVSDGACVLGEENVRTHEAVVGEDGSISVTLSRPDPAVLRTFLG